MQLHYPNHICCDWHGLDRLPELLKACGGDYQSYFLVTGKGSYHDKSIQQLEAMLGKALGIFRNIQSEPELQDVDAICEELRKYKPDMLIAIGGGSIIDAAKAAAVIAVAEAPCRDYFYGTCEIKKAGIPFIAIPTTAGTGAEITKNSVITDPESKIKKSIRHPLMTARIAICDGDLTLSMPARQTAFSGMDALTQAIEAYVTRKASRLSKSLAAEAIKLILQNLPKVFENGYNEEARQLMAEGSLLSAMSFSQTGLGAVHGLAHPMGSLLEIPHGECCAILLPEVMRFNLPVAKAAFGELARQNGMASAENFLEHIESLCQKLDIPKNLKAFGLAETHYPFIIENCRSNSMSGNPREMSDEDVRSLLESMS